jgi:PPOX class probable F420-dependent enzyme
MQGAPLPSGLEDFLAKPLPAVVATLRENGTPVTAATWYEWIDGRAMLSMSASGPRIRNIRRDPRVALTVLGEDWYAHVSLLGRAVEVREDTGFEDLDRLSMRYLGRPYSRKDHVVVTVFVEVDRWHTYGDPGS